MKKTRLPSPRPLVTALASLLLAGLVAVSLLDRRTPVHADEGAFNFPGILISPNDSGAVATFAPDGPINTHTAFFQSLGSNGRACVNCHQPRDAWSITPDHIQDLFNATAGLDPLFRTVDGSNRPDADVSTRAARRRAYSMLLTKGLIRIHKPIPANAEFTLDAVDDPYGYANAGDLSLFRRPLPATNLSFLTTVMWDGRQTLSAPDGSFSLGDSLTAQVTDAVLTHAQGAQPPTTAQIQQIVAFETGLYSAQLFDNSIGFLNGQGGAGGPFALAQQPFYFGINDVLGADPHGVPFDSSAMTLYAGWENARGDWTAAARRSVARGEVIFNTKQFVVTGVAGLNDLPGLSTLTATCTTCHDTPNVGNHSVKLPINIGLTDASRRTPDLPLYTLRNTATGETVQTTDPGRALITGKWKDIGKFKGPILRGLAARAPYFHNGSAATLGDAVDFYNTRFGVGFTVQEKKDLVAFLRTL